MYCEADFFNLVLRIFKSVKEDAIDEQIYKTKNDYIHLYNTKIAIKLFII